MTAVEDSLVDKLETISRELAAKGIHKPLINLGLGRPSGDSVASSQSEGAYKATAGYYDDDGKDVITEELQSVPATDEDMGVTPHSPQEGPKDPLLEATSLN